MADGGDASFCSRDRKHQKDCKYFADGGDTSDDNSDNDIPDTSSGFDVAENQPAQTVTDPAASQAPIVPAAPAAPAAPEPPDEEEEQEENEANEEQNPTPPSVQTQGNLQDHFPGQTDGQALTTLTTPTAEQLYQQHLASAADIAANPIHAKTMGDLFASQSTLGKIGSIFGLLLSGAGSGLAHQQNAALAAMQQQINNDLQAQQANKTGAQNFLNMANAYQLQQTQQKLLNAQASQIPLQNALTAANIQNLKQNTNLLAVNTAKANMLLTTVGHLQNGVVNTMPPGPQQQAAQQILDSAVKPAVNQQIQTDAADTVGKINTAAAIRASQEGAPPAPSINDLPPGQMDAAVQSNLNNMRAGAALGEPSLGQAADSLQSRYIPGVGISTKEIPQQDQAKISAASLYNDRLQAFKQKIANLSDEDRINPAVVNDLMVKKQELVSSYAAALGSSISPQEEGKLDSIIPNGTAVLPSFRALPQLNALDQDNKLRVSTLLNQYGFSPNAMSRVLRPGAIQSGNSAIAVQPDGTKGTANGIPFTWKGGKRIRDIQSGAPQSSYAEDEGLE